MSEETPVTEVQAPAAEEPAAQPAATPSSGETPAPEAAPAAAAAQQEAAPEAPEPAAPEAAPAPAAEAPEAPRRRSPPAHDLDLSAAMSRLDDKAYLDPDIAQILLGTDPVEEVKKPVREDDLETFFIDESRMRHVYPTYPVKVVALSAQAWNIIQYRSRKADLAILRIEVVMPRIATPEELAAIEKLLQDSLEEREKAYEEGIRKVKALLSSKNLPTEDKSEVEYPHQARIRIHQHTMLRFLGIVKKFDEYAMLLNQAAFFGLVPNKSCQKILNDEESTMRRLVDKLFSEQQRISDAANERRRTRSAKGAAQQPQARRS